MLKVLFNDFVIGLPGRWTDDSVIILTAPPRGDHSPTITVTRDHLEASSGADEYAAGQLSALHREMAGGDYKVLDEGVFLLAGSSGYQRTHTFVVTDPEGVETRVTQMQLYAVRGREAITVTCTDAAEFFEQSKPSFLEALGHFRWRG